LHGFHPSNQNKKMSFEHGFTFLFFLFFSSLKIGDVLKVASRYNQISLEDLRYFNGASKFKRSDSAIPITLRSPTALRYRVKIKNQIISKMRSPIALRFKC